MCEKKKKERGIRVDGRKKLMRFIVRVRAFSNFLTGSRPRRYEEDGDGLWKSNPPLSRCLVYFDNGFISLATHEYTA